MLFTSGGGGSNHSSSWSNDSGRFGLPVEVMKAGLLELLLLCSDVCEKVALLPLDPPALCASLGEGRGEIPREDVFV